VVITNIVNGDMVGHTGIIEACHKAVAVVDECVGKITDAVLAKGGTALVLADHGNIEDQTEGWRTSHTLSKVPFILVSDALKSAKLRTDGGLQDVSPTALAILGLSQPAEMTGTNLIIEE
jgi:2,3-bisphosphoglycerate-independent phosphoglycerate mutase